MSKRNQNIEAAWGYAEDPREQTTPELLRGVILAIVGLAEVIESKAKVNELEAKQPTAPKQSLLKRYEDGF